MAKGSGLSLAKLDNAVKPLWAGFLWMWPCSVTKPGRSLPKSSVRFAGGGSRLMITSELPEEVGIPVSFVTLALGERHRAEGQQ